MSYFAPIKNSGKLIHLCSPLLEKAFAKAHGDYGSLNHGYCHEGIEDLTGLVFVLVRILQDPYSAWLRGVAICMATKDIMDPDKFWKDELMKANKDRMFGCSVDYNGNGEPFSIY